MYGIVALTAPLIWTSVVPNVKPIVPVIVNSGVPFSFRMIEPDTLTVTYGPGVAPVAGAVSESFGGAPKIVSVDGVPAGMRLRISCGIWNGWSRPLELNITFALPLNSKKLVIVEK